MILTPAFRDTPRTAIGLVVLAADETLERAARARIPDQIDLFVSRIPSAPIVTSETLAEMEHALPRAAGLFPAHRRLDAVGYGCTSGTAQIGADRIDTLLSAATGCARTTNPLSALIDACAASGFHRIGIVSPYVEDVSATLRARLAEAGIATPAFATFNIPDEHRVASITPDAIAAGAIRLAQTAELDAIFLSCTNLDTAQARPSVTRTTGLPCLCSNSVLIDNLLAHATAADRGPSPPSLFS